MSSNVDTLAPQHELTMAYALTDGHHSVISPQLDVEAVSPEPPSLRIPERFKKIAKLRSANPKRYAMNRLSVKTEQPFLTWKRSFAIILTLFVASLFVSNPNQKSWLQWKLGIASVRSLALPDLRSPASAEKFALRKIPVKKLLLKKSPVKKLSIEKSSIKKKKPLSKSKKAKTLNRNPLPDHEPDFFDW